ncbi:MAG: hypothetical protein BWY26_01638 [Elusimicrobia bacterium ADurb.Bin231]|nr:MAG: hypothetical protein BWY26_01638 [Elusimicrobia bacterium ADurb.Bin231]
MKTNNRGFTLIEVIITVTILALLVIPIISIHSYMSRHSVVIKEKIFTTQKALQMMEELRGLVAGTEKKQIDVLDDYDDGVVFKNNLTTDRNVVSPDASPSDNVFTDGKWKYVRRISVIKMPEEPFSRKVYIRVYKNTGQNPEKLAETVSVLKTIVMTYSPIQVADLFIIAIENVPGWWSSLSLMRPIMESILQDLQTRCPNLEIRVHWITRLAFGRDSQYVPYINDSSYTNDVSMPYVYFYPGRMRKSDGADFLFYDSDLFQSRINLDDSIKENSSYPLADMYNHAVRYPDEERLYNEAVAAANSKGMSPPEISLRMLIEKMNSSSQVYNNIILMNLHGELLPLPPMRNYSDAAKDPENYPYVRVVSHPERIQYNSGDAVKLRVYPYVTEPSLFSSTSALQTLSVYLPNDYILPGQTVVEKINGNENHDYERVTVLAGTDTYNISYPAAGGTLFTFYDNPLRHAPNGNKGLPLDKWLYGMEYIPCPVHPAGTPEFTYDLTNNNANNPKNTARWIITFTAGILADGIHTIETRIGEDITAGALSNKPSNLSRTYTWVGVTPPVTEQYQFMGDPRHMPYKDVKKTDPPNPKEQYNWYFTDINEGDYKGFTEASNGWGDDGVDIDIPRFYQMIRQGLMNTQAVWSAMNGFSFYYYGIGGEFGSDMEPLPYGIPFRKMPWSATGETSFLYVDEILPYCNGSPNVTYNKVVARTDNSWYAKYWLGELYPDYDYSVWKSTGNLPTGVGRYYRTNHDTFTSFGRNRTRRTGSKGCSSFFNGGYSSNRCFKHISSDSSFGAITSLGNNIASMFNFPLLSSISAPRPFSLNYSGDYPTEWNESEYSALRTVLSIPQIDLNERIFYDSNYSPFSYDACSTVKMTKDTDTAYIAVSGLATQANFGTAQIGKLVLVTLLRSFMDGGLYSGQDKISQIPYVDLKKPLISDTFDNPLTININWDVVWKRWDLEKYTEEYPDDYVETTPLVYAVKYSNDNGKSWYYCLDDTPTSAGKKDYPMYTTTSTDYYWTVSSKPAGTYLIRIECYRRDIDLHYGYDQIQVNIRK